MFTRHVARARRNLAKDSRLRLEALSVSQRLYVSITCSRDAIYFLCRVEWSRMRTAEAVEEPKQVVNKCS